MVALSYGELESHLETISNIKPFINKHNWKKKIFQQKYMPGIYPVYILKHNSILEKQTIISMILNEKRVKSICIIICNNFKT